MAETLRALIQEQPARDRQLAQFGAVREELRRNAALASAEAIAALLDR